jgi:hypothetical protein
VKTLSVCSLVSTVAHAPRNVNRKIPTLKDLENDIKAVAPTAEVFMSLSFVLLHLHKLCSACLDELSVQEGWNFAVLLTTLVPASMVQEEDTAWTFESLLRVSICICCVSMGSILLFFVN